MATENEDQILEGFLCPICMTDLRSAVQLTIHFETKHQEEQAVLKSIKGFFDSILNKKNEETDLKDTLDDFFMVKKNTSFDYEEQTIGVFRNSSDYFKGVRSSRLERYAAETNKLLIRLDKLVTNVPTDLVNRKQHEKDVVPWLDGTAVSRCPNCAKSFNITRRKHHCRLCGSIICHECSLFLDIDEAKTIVDPSAPQPQQMGQEVTEKNSLRLCEHCYNLIELRKQVQESRNAKPTLVAAYEQMRVHMDDAKPAVEMYEKMCQSLFNGEMIYNLTDVNRMRGRIGKMAEQIDLLSKQIAALPAEPGTRQAKLQNSIRQAATQYIKEELLSMRKLPTEDQIEQIKKQRYKHAKDSIESDRRREMETIEPPEATGSSKPVVVHDEDNPLLQQINIVRGLLADARKDMKFDEVAILEANLKELKKEYQLQMLFKSNNSQPNLG